MALHRGELCCHVHFIFLDAGFVELNGFGETIIGPTFACAASAMFSPP
jgi:hypothetical protein